MQRMLKLRPYRLGVSNGVLEDLERQLISQEHGMKVADFIAFAEGAESYMRQKYGDMATQQIMASRDHWTGIANFKRDMTVLWESLNYSMQDRLRHEPIHEVLDDICTSELPMEGGRFVFAE